MQATTTESEPTGTTVLLTNPERERLRAKAQDTAAFLGIRSMSLSAYIRWAALNIDIKRDATTMSREMEVA